MIWTKLIRRSDLEVLLANAREQEPVRGTRREKDFRPVVRLTVPLTACSWLLSELEPDGIAFGLCDLGAGYPELGSVYLGELMEVNVRGLRVVQDMTWRADKTISQYARNATAAQRIVL